MTDRSRPPPGGPPIEEQEQAWLDEIYHSDLREALEASRTEWRALRSAEERQLLGSRDQGNNAPSVSAPRRSSPSPSVERPYPASDTRRRESVSYQASGSSVRSGSPRYTQPPLQRESSPCYTQPPLQRERRPSEMLPPQSPSRSRYFFHTASLNGTGSERGYSRRHILDSQGRDERGRIIFDPWARDERGRRRPLSPYREVIYRER